MLSVPLSESVIAGPRLVIGSVAGPGAATAGPDRQRHDLGELWPGEPARHKRFAWSAAGRELGPGEDIEVGVQPPAICLGSDVVHRLAGGAYGVGGQVAGCAQPDAACQRRDVQGAAMDLIGRSEHWNTASELA